MSYTRITPKFQKKTISGQTSNSNIVSDISTNYAIVCARLMNNIEWGQVIPWTAPNTNYWRFRAVDNNGFKLFQDGTNVTIEVVYV